MNGTVDQIMGVEGREEAALPEILSAISLALDLTEDAVPGHTLRSTLLGMRVGRELGLSSAMSEALFYALQLKDAGCSNNADRMAHLIGGDERKAKAAARLADWTSLRGADYRTLRLLWRAVLPEASMANRALRMLKIGLSQQRLNREMIDLRCERGAEIVRRLGIGEVAAEAVYRLDEHWNGSGYPGRLRQTHIPLLSRICLLVQTLDLFAAEDGVEAARRMMKKRSASWFDPALVEIVCRLDNEGRLWQACEPGSPIHVTRGELLRKSPVPLQALARQDVDTVCLAFADIVDAKSPFTYQHSVRVADAAVALGRQMGLGEDRITLLRRAALLHNLGKLGVSNAILDKPSRLSVEERASMTKHPSFTRMILKRIPGFEEIARVAGEHHERLDGSGYPEGLHGAQLGIESRILAVADSFATLAEERPYREAYPPAKILATLRALTPHRLDEYVIEALAHFMTLQGRGHAA